MRENQNLNRSPPCLFWKIYLYISIDLYRSIYLYIKIQIFSKFSLEQWQFANVAVFISRWQPCKSLCHFSLKRHLQDFTVQMATCIKYIPKLCQTELEPFSSILSWTAQQSDFHLETWTAKISHGPCHFALLSPGSLVMMLFSTDPNELENLS